MAEFQNTIDVLGDDIVSRMLVERTIEEYNDDLLGSITEYAFCNCTKLISVNLPNVTSVDSYSFSGCTALISVNLPSLTSITGWPSSSLFNYCRALISVNLPLVTNVGKSAFSYCNTLPSVDFPSATKIEDSAFKSCVALTTIILRSETACTLGNTNVFTSTPFASGGTGGKCLVPRSLIETYQTATNWSTLYAAGTCTFLAIEDYTVDGTITGEIDWDKLNGGN